MHGKHQPFRIAEQKATKHPQQLLNLPRARSDSEWSKIKFFAKLSFKKACRRRPPVKKSPRVRSEASGAKIKFFAPLSFKKEGRRRPPVKKNPSPPYIRQK